MKLKDLAHHPGNPRKLSDKQFEMLKKSYEKFGPLHGFVYNDVTKRLNGGHQTSKVLDPNDEIVIEKKFKNPTKHGTIAQGYVIHGDERFPFRKVLWDENTEKAAMIAANQHGGDWDFPILTDWVIELDGLNIDTDLLGFDKTQIEKMMNPGQDKNNLDKALKDISEFIIVVECTSEMEQKQIFEDLESKGLKCKLIT